MTDPESIRADTSLNTSLNPALDPLVLNPCRRSQLFRAEGSQLFAQKTTLSLDFNLV